MAEAEEQFTNKLLLLLKPFKLCAWSCDSLGITIAASPQMMATQDFNTVNVVTFSQHTCAAGCCNLTQRRLPLFLTLAKFPSRVGGCSRAVSGQCQVKQEGAANSWWIIIQSFSALCCWCRESNNWVHTLFQAKDCFFFSSPVSVPVSPLCVQHASRLLGMLKIPCPLSERRRPNSWWHENAK